MTALSLDQIPLEVLRGVADGRYRLLLGAGGSQGAHSADGRELPLAAGMRDELLALLPDGPPAHEPPSLDRAYRVALRTAREDVGAYLRKRFSNCTPTWHSAIVRLPWRRIWTLNLDDVVERAFAQTGRGCDPFAWSDLHRETRDSDGKIQVIHLHGRAIDSDEFANDPRVVLSLNEYATTLRDRRTWHGVFVDELRESPFIVLGARLVDEFDLADWLQAGSRAEEMTGLPSLVVTRDPDEFAVAELEGLGLKVLRASAEDFITALDAGVRELNANRTSDEQVTDPRFLRQFIPLDDWHPRPTVTVPDYLQGAEPDWPLVRDRDAVAPFSSITTLAERVGSIDAKGYVVVTGEPGSGKTTSLYAAARELIRRGFEPWWFRGDEGLTVDAARGALAKRPRAVLIFDDAADFAHEIQILLDSDLPQARVVVAERSYRLKNLNERLLPSLRAGVPIETGRLDDNDARALIVVLRNHGRLGRITRMPESEQVAYFVRDHRRHLWSALAELEVRGGARWVDRWSGVHREIRGTTPGNVLAIASLCEYLGYRVRLSIAARATSASLDEIDTALAGPLHSLLVLGDSGLRTPHRLVSESVVLGSLSRDERYALLLALAKALAQHVDVASIVGNTRNYRLARRVMNHDVIIELLGLEVADSWYEDIRVEYDWNGRYWDQRALLAVDRKDFPPARSYAEKSVEIDAHPFALNTLGTVLMHVAENQRDADELLAAVRYLERSRDDARRREFFTDQHPAVTFFSGMLRFAERYGIQEVPPSLRTAWAQWYQRAQNDPYFAFGYADDLTRWQERWLKLAT